MGCPPQLGGLPSTYPYSFAQPQPYLPASPPLRPVPKSIPVAVQRVELPPPQNLGIQLRERAELLPPQNLGIELK